MMRQCFAVLSVLILMGCGNGSSSDKDVLDGDLMPVDLLEEVSDSDTPETDVALPDDGGEIVDPVDTVEEDIQETTGKFESMTTAPKGDLRAIWGSATRLYAVGEDGVILRRQGTTWTPMKSPTDKTLLAIFGAADDDIYAAGVEGTLLHYDGTAWASVDTGLELDLSELSLAGIWGGEGQFYVVGDKGTILHHFEGKWKADESLSSYNLGDVWGVSVSDVYVGAAGGTVLRKIGGAWSSQQVTQGSITINGIQALSSKAIYGGGTNGGIIAHDAAGWSPKLSNDAYERTLHDVWAFAEDDVWMVGEDGSLIHLEATKWNTQTMTDSFYSNHSFYGLWGKTMDENQEALAVGEKGAMIAFDGETWTDRPSSAAVDFNDLDGESWESALAVGADGTLLRWDGEGWYGLERLGNAVLRGVAVANGKAIVAGDDGTIMAVEGDAPSLVDAGLSVDLFGACAGDGFVVVGAQGKVFTSDDGATWEAVSSGVFDTLRDCVVADDGAIWAVGDMGKIVQISGETSTVVPVATLANLHRITQAPSGALMAVGDNGLILTNSDGEWTKAYEEPGLFLYGIAAFDNIVYAVGWAGRVLSLDPASDEVTQVDVPDSGVMLQIWGPDADHLLVVGKKGKMLHYVAQ